VLTAANINAEAEVVDLWRKMKPGTSANVPAAELPRAFLDIAAPKTGTDARFIGGEFHLCRDASNYADGVPGARLSPLEKLLAGTRRSRAAAAEKK
jgi:hypothetical protein